MSGGFSTDTFSFSSTMINAAADQNIFLGTFTGPSGGGTNLHLEIYFHANGYSQTDAATAANLLSPSKITVMLQILNGDNGGIGINITGYAIQHGNFPWADALTAVQGLPWDYKIYIKMKAYGNPVVHATTTSTGTWTPSMTIDSAFSNWGSTYAAKTTGVTGYKIPIQYKFKNGMIETPNGFNVSSSRRYKTNITDLPENYNLDMVMKMKPIIYQKIDEPGNPTFYPGLIAEDLHDLSANIFVSYNQNNVPESLDYARINVLLVKATQELNERVDGLSKELRSLQPFFL